ncbi:MAG: VOC family protein [Coriobacteriia bacterium]|nr:VOC family protein [Coriobacteriia bacterium]MCL2537702.1 VOC family protein [Coriobacteriia bacterium]
MLCEMFINFDGQCAEALEFYSKAFGAPIENVMKYSDTPPSDDYTVPDADKDRIMYAGIPMGNMTLMFMDFPSGSSFTKGNNISPTVSFADTAEVTRTFEALSEGGTVLTAPSKTFFSDLYASVEDKFGVIWQILHYDPETATY